MAEKKFFEKGTVIFKEGAWELSMYDIISGKVGIYADYGEENETLLTELGAGRYFGEMAVIDAMPRSATAVALEDTQATAVKSGEFDEYLTENPDKVIDVFQSLCTRLRELSNDYLDACATIGEYVQAEDEKKAKTFMGKIKKLLALYYSYYDHIERTYNFNDNASNYIYF
ncbi:MAG: cyclic nucleotide-binding domain-containing protein [Clostridia bacterium]|nr:cyclic nucleotide-binding domain-containing protein [Clostridia bacterium]